MGIKQIPLEKFLRWLESKGLVKEREHSSHLMYNFPERDPRRLTRPIVVRPKYKDIPLFHIHTNLQTLRITKKQFEKEIKEL